MDSLTALSFELRLMLVQHAEEPLLTKYEFAGEYVPFRTASDEPEIVRLQSGVVFVSKSYDIKPDADAPLSKVTSSRRQVTGAASAAHEIPIKQRNDKAKTRMTLLNTSGFRV